MAFEHPDRARLIERSSNYAPTDRRSSSTYNGKEEVDPKDRWATRSREDESKLSNGRRDRSRSPYRSSLTVDDRERSRSRSLKRRRRESLSPHRYRPDSRDHHTRRRRSSYSPSPHRYRDPPQGYRNKSRSPRARKPSSPDAPKRSRRHYSVSRSPPPRRRSPKPSRRSKHRSPPARCRSPDSPRRSKHRSRHSRSPPPMLKRVKAPLPSQQDAFSGDTAVIKPDEPPPIEKQKPNYAPTGALAKETNTVAGTSVVLKYNEPPESRLPPASAKWRLYVFKDEKELENIQLHTRTCWLLGRERAVVDMPIEHPSCSKQHAVIQFRYTEKRGEFGDRKGGVKPYIIDLDSANGTSLNGEKIEGRRYMELRTGDVLKFGDSTREYVLLLPPKD